MRLVDTTCWTLIGALVTALLSVTAWGVKQSHDKEVILRDWLKATLEKNHLLSLVENATPGKDPKGGQ